MRMRPVAAVKALSELSISKGLKDKLLQHFTTEAALAHASISSLLAVRGIGPKKAQAIHEALTQATTTAIDTLPTPLRPKSAQAEAVNGTPVKRSMRAGKGHTINEIPGTTDLMQEYSHLQKLERAYVGGAPMVSDSVYDSMKVQLLRKARAQDADSMVVERLESAVGAPVSHHSPLAKVEHTVEFGGRLRSLAAAHSAAEVRAWWVRNIEPHFGGQRMDDVEVVLEPKVDGLTMRATYRDGNCIQAATRGDGTTGEDVTYNIKSISGLPKQVSGIPGAEGVFSVRGEVYIALADFQAVNAARTQQGMDLLSNARNAAVGSLRHSDPAETSRRKLSFAAFELIQQSRTGGHCSTQTDAVQQLASWGFATLQPYIKKVKGIDQAIEAGKHLLQQRSTLPFQIDGYVLKLNDLQEHEQIGETATDPKWAIAWKPAPTEAVTVIEDIVVSVGRSGVVVPVAVLTPVGMSGVTVSRASLHNTHFPSTLDLYVGDTVVIERRGDVIPQVASVVRDKRPQAARPWVPPTHCPACNKPLKHRKTESSKDSILLLECGNPACGGKKVKQLERFADVAIKGVGKKVVQSLAEKGFVETAADFYRLERRREALESLPGFGHKRVKNILDAIEASKKTTLSALLLALGISGIGSATADLLLQNCGASILGVANTSKSELVELPGISNITAGRITAWFGFPDNLSLATELASLWSSQSQPMHQVDAQLQQEGVSVAGMKLAPGDEIVATGAIGVSRPLIKQWAEAHSLVLKGSVSKSTKLLILGSTKGTEETSKQKTARKYGTRTIYKDDEIQELEQLVQQAV